MNTYMDAQKFKLQKDIKLLVLIFLNWFFTIKKKQMSSNVQRQCFKIQTKHLLYFKNIVNPITIMDL